jgi:hypothetical protein
MRNVKTDNNDLIQYLKTVEELKNHISIEEYKKNIANFVLIVFLSLKRKIQISTYRTTSFEQKKGISS